MSYIALVMRSKSPIFFIILFLLILPALVLTATRICDFHGKRQNNTVILEWATEEETDLAKFMIQRTNDINDAYSWLTIGEKTPLAESAGGRREYNFTDNTIFKNQFSGTFYYRLMIVNSQGQQSEHDVIVSISGTSGIRHTWGSIKAMFR